MRNNLKLASSQGISPRSAVKSWIPVQHGAWAMATIPVICGVVFAANRGAFTLTHLGVVVTWLVGYFWFSTMSLWVKTPARRRDALRMPFTLYGIASVLSGLLTLVAAWRGGLLALLWWLVWFAPLIALALAQLVRRHERDLSSGFATIAAASSLATVLPYLDPRVLWRSWSSAWVDVAISVLLFAYFFGTVFVVKTVVRKRGSQAWLIASDLFHGVALSGVISLVAQLPGLPSATHVAIWSLWIVFFTGCFAQALAFPLLQRRGRTITPRLVGLTQIAFSVVALALALGTHLSA